MGAPSDQILRILYGTPLVSVSHTILGAHQVSFLAYYMGPQAHFLSLLCGGPLRSVFFRIEYGGPSQISFFSYNMGAIFRSVSSFTICGPPSDEFLCILWGPPKISFCAYYMGAPQINFFAYYMGAPSDQFFRILLGVPFRSVFSLTIWGPHKSVSSQNNWGPLGQFVRILHGTPQVSFFA